MAAVIVAVALACVPPPTMAARIPTLTPTGGYGAWTVHDEAPSLVDGSPNFSAGVNSDDTVVATRGLPKKALLAVFCDHSGFNVQIQWPAQINIKRGRQSETLLWKLDGGRLYQNELDFNKTSLIQLGRPGNTLAHLWAAGKVLAVRVPDRFGGQDATFHIDGLDLVMAHIDQIGCGPAAKAR